MGTSEHVRMDQGHQVMNKNNHQQNNMQQSQTTTQNNNANMNPTAQTFRPTVSNPYSHMEVASSMRDSDPILITPTVSSPADIYEYQRLPSGIVVTTVGG